MDNEKIIKVYEMLDRHEPKACISIALIFKNLFSAFEFRHIEKVNHNICAALYYKFETEGEHGGMILNIFRKELLKDKALFERYYTFIPALPAYNNKKVAVLSALTAINKTFELIDLPINPDALVPSGACPGVNKLPRPDEGVLCNG